MSNPEVQTHLLSRYRAAVRERVIASEALGAVGAAYEVAKEQHAKASHREYDYDRILQAEGMATSEIDTVRRAVEDATREEA